jgi:hypothetical protein
VDQARSRQLGVIKRFTGGGTVVVDADTVFTTLIMQVSGAQHSVGALLSCFSVVPQPTHLLASQMSSSEFIRVSAAAPQEGAVPGLECFPVPIMRWTEQFYLEVFQKHGGFKLREHGKHADACQQQVPGWQMQSAQTGFASHGVLLSLLPPADYVFGERKFGGNAQAITSKRWLHHTSLLWDYDPLNMAVLTNPRKQPAYRQVCTGCV